MLIVLAKYAVGVVLVIPLGILAGNLIDYVRHGPMIPSEDLRKAARLAVHDGIDWSGEIGDGPDYYRRMRALTKRILAAHKDDD